MRNKKIAVIFLSLSFFMPVTRIDAKEQRFSFGFNAGLSNWPSDAFKFMKFRPQESYWLNFQMMNVLEQEIELNTRYNFNFRYSFTPRLGIQAEIEHQKADYWAFLALFPKTGSNAIYPQHHLCWSISSIFFNLIYMPGQPGEKIIPYGFVGLGLCFVRGEDESNQDYYVIDIPSSVDLGLKAGAGLSFYWLPPLGFDLRSFIQVLGLRFGAYASSYSGGDIYIGGWNIIWGVELGLTYRF